MGPEAGGGSGGAPGPVANQPDLRMVGVLEVPVPGVVLQGVVVAGCMHHLRLRMGGGVGVGQREVGGSQAWQGHGAPTSPHPAPRSYCFVAPPHLGVGPGAHPTRPGAALLSCFLPAPHPIVVPSMVQGIHQLLGLLEDAALPAAGLQTVVRQRTGRQAGRRGEGYAGLHGRWGRSAHHTCTTSPACGPLATKTRSSTHLAHAHTHPAHPHTCAPPVHKPGTSAHMRTPCAPTWHIRTHAHPLCTHLVHPHKHGDPRGPVDEEAGV